MFVGERLIKPQARTPCCFTVEPSVGKGVSVYINKQASVFADVCTQEAKERKLFMNEDKQ